MGHGPWRRNRHGIDAHAHRHASENRCAGVDRARRLRRGGSGSDRHPALCRAEGGPQREFLAAPARAPPAANSRRAIWSASCRRAAICRGSIRSRPANRDGVLEICVRKHPGGLCSSFLHELEPGVRIEAFIRKNPAFRPARGKAPLILIGAGTGIGPLAGFIRHNAGRRRVHLYWGGRDPASDFLYEGEMAKYLADRRLTRLNTVFSRVPGGGYVQDRIASDANELRDLIQRGAQVLVCGGRDMAAGVARSLEAIIAPMGLELQTLKSTGRYVEDVY